MAAKPFELKFLYAGVNLGDATAPIFKALGTCPGVTLRTPPEISQVTVTLPTGDEPIIIGRGIRLDFEVLVSDLDAANRALTDFATNALATVAGAPLVVTEDAGAAALKGAVAYVNVRWREVGVSRMSSSPRIPEGLTAIYRNS